MAFGYIAECASPKDLDKVIGPTVDEKLIEKTTDFLESGVKNLRKSAMHFAGVICSGPISLMDKFMVKDPLPIIKKYLESIVEGKFLLDILYVLTNLIRGPYRFLSTVVDSGIGKSLIELLRNKTITAKVRVL